MYGLYFRLNEIVHATNSINSRPKTIQHSRVLVVCAILLKINLHSLHIYFPVVAIIKCFPIDSFALITWLQIEGKFKNAGEHYDRRMEIKDAPYTYCVCHRFRMRFCLPSCLSAWCWRYRLMQWSYHCECGVFWIISKYAPNDKSNCER